MSTASVTIIIKNIQTPVHFSLLNTGYASQDKLKGYGVTPGFTSLVPVLHWSLACLAQCRSHFYQS